MNTARNYEYPSYEASYENYDLVAESLKNNAREEAQKRYKNQNGQAIHKRFLNLGMIIFMISVLFLPFIFTTYRYAKVHQAQNEVSRMKFAIAEYDTKANEIKERLESNTSLDELEIYARDKLSMMKASSSKVIILQDFESQIKIPKTKFSISRHRK